MENSDYTKEIDLGLAKILVISNLLNRKTELCCFVHDVAHCRVIEVRLFKDVKSYNKTPVTFSMRYDEGKYNKDNKDRLDAINRCVEFLENTLKEKKVDYGVLHQIKEYVTIAYEI